MALDLVKILADHKLWLARNGGCRADLQGANLQDAYLQDAYLQDAYLQDAYLQRANLQRADLQRADLRGADLYGANLYGANLYGAKLQGANLQGADLQRADLQDANLRGAKNVPDTARLFTQIVPDTGAFEGWKRTRDAIVHLQIPATAARSNATGRKCRAECAKVLAIYRNGKASKEPAESEGGGKYVVGRITKCHEWDADRWNECSGGIHFFITRAEAEAW